MTTSKGLFACIRENADKVPQDVQSGIGLEAVLKDMVAASDKLKLPYKIMSPDENGVWSEHEIRSPEDLEKLCIP